MRYIYNCKRCKVARSVDYPDGDNKRGWSRRDAAGQYYPAGIYISRCGGGQPTIYGGDTESGLCPSCGKMMDYGPVNGTFNPDHKCDARCTGARGHNCDCSCGGANHGIAWG